MLTIYHNTRCRKSRAGLDYIERKGLNYKVIEYLKNPLSIGELNELIQKLNIKPLDLIRTQEEIYKTRYKGKTLTDDQWIAAIAEHPNLLQRPIVVNGNKAVLAQPPEEINKIL